MSCRRWTAADDARLRDLYPVTPTSELPALLGRSRMAIKVRAAAMHLRKDPAVSMRRPWHPDEDHVIRLLYADTPTDGVAAVIGRSVSSTFQRARKLGLAKDPAFLASEAAGRIRRGDHRGRDCWFPKGHVPANKGVKHPKGWAPGRMRETQFKPGTRAGVAVALWKPVGSERVSKDGYLERKIRDGVPPGLSRREENRYRMRSWRAVHLLVWEAANGPLPKGHAVAFRNGDKTDIRLDNLVLVSRADLMRRNSVHNLPAPLPQTIQLLGALNRKINRKERASA